MIKKNVVAGMNIHSLTKEELINELKNGSHVFWWDK